MSGDDGTPPDHRMGFDDLVVGLTFLTRLPVSARGPADDPGDLAGAAWTFPIVGALVGLAGGVTLLIAVAMGIPGLLAGLFAVLATILMTGALHEDGLADTADGFGGGGSRGDKLEIMRDSRLGTYGGLALLFSVLVRAAVLEGLLADGAASAMFVLIAAEAMSRGALARVWHDLPAARQDGLAASAGWPDERTSLTALAIGAAIAIVLSLPMIGLWAALVALAGSAAAAIAFAGFSRFQIGGQTGDTLGATQQVAAIAYLLLALAFS